MSTNDLKDPTTALLKKITVGVHTTYFILMIGVIGTIIFLTLINDELREIKKLLRASTITSSSNTTASSTNPQPPPKAIYNLNLNQMVANFVPTTAREVSFKQNGQNITITSGERVLEAIPPQGTVVMTISQSRALCFVHPKLHRWLIVYKAVDLLNWSWMIFEADGSISDRQTLMTEDELLKKIASIDQ